MLDIDQAFRTGAISKVEAEGYEASLRHEPLTNNPYSEDSWEHEVWGNGHASAEHMSTARHSAYC